jgi:dynein heavy chain
VFSVFLLFFLFHHVFSTVCFLVCSAPEVNNQRKACYFLRQSDKPINCKFATDATVTFGELLPGLLTLWKSSVEKVFAPILREKDDWGQANNAKECGDFLDQTDDFVAGLERQLGNLKGEVELRMPMFDFSPFELKPAVYTKLAAHKELITESAVVLKEWADKVRAYLNTQNTVNLADLSPSEGPKVEIEYWGRKMLTLQSILDQLKTKPGRGVLGVFGAYVKSVRDDTSANAAAPVASKDAQQVLTYWQDTDALLTDALNEAADNVKFLSNLDKFLEPLYKGTPAAIADALPSLMSAMKMIHTLSRHYGMFDVLRRDFYLSFSDFCCAAWQVPPRA